jgi:hypothetical protein
MFSNVSLFAGCSCEIEGNWQSLRDEDPKQVGDVEESWGKNSFFPYQRIGGQPPSYTVLIYSEAHSIFFIIWLQFMVNFLWEVRKHEQTTLLKNGDLLEMHYKETFLLWGNQGHWAGHPRPWPLWHWLQIRAPHEMFGSSSCALYFLVDEYKQDPLITTCIGLHVAPLLGGCFRSFEHYVCSPTCSASSWWMSSILWVGYFEQYVCRPTCSASSWRMSPILWAVCV